MNLTAESSADNETYSPAAKAVTIPPNSQPFVYDHDGNLSSDAMWAYTYDGENRLIQMDTTSDAHNYAGLPYARLAFTYDYAGRRVEKKVGTVSGSTVTWTSDDRYVYDGNNLIADYQVSGSTLSLYRTFTWGLDVTGSLTSAGGVGALLEITNVSGTTTTDFFPMYDGNGNVACVVNANASLGAVYEYSPFGEQIQAKDTDSTVADNPFRFSTKFTDVETNLIDYGNRYYSPSMGRFINRDPAEEGGGNNLYAFCSNDAINLFDVLGNDPGGSNSYGQADSTTQGTSSPPAGGTYNNPQDDPTNPNGIAYWEFDNALEGGTQAAAESMGNFAILAGIASGSIQVQAADSDLAGEGNATGTQQMVNAANSVAAQHPNATGTMSNDTDIPGGSSGSVKELNSSGTVVEDETGKVFAWIDQSTGSNSSSGNWSQIYITNGGESTFNYVFGGGGFSRSNAAVPKGTNAAGSSWPTLGLFSSRLLESSNTIIEAAAVAGDTLKSVAHGTSLGTAGEVIGGGANMYAAGSAIIQTLSGDMSPVEGAVKMGEVALAEALPPPGDAIAGGLLLAGKEVPELINQGIREATNNLPVNPPGYSTGAAGVNMGGGVIWDEERPW